MNKDLTQGKPETALIRFSIPLLGSILFQQLYNIADSLVAGKFIGENALAAVGNSYEITLIFIAFAFGSNIGCSVIISQLFGAKRMTELKSAVNTTLIACGVLVAALTLFGFIFCPSLLRLINTPEDIFADSLLYLNIYVGGLVFLFFYNIATGIFSALGDSKTPFYFLAASSTANIFMDILFVTSFDMGVSGVAWATFLCQGVSCVLSLLALFKRLKTIKCDEKPKLFCPDLLNRITRIAVPSILQQSFISIGNILIQSVINGFGTGVVAGYAASIKLNNLVVTCLTTLGNGMSNFTAQNIGAGKMERVKQGHKGGLMLCYALCVPVFIFYFFFSKTAMNIFIDSASPDAMNSGIMFLKIVSPFYFAVATKLLTDGVLRGAGAMKHFMVATFTDLILRVALAYLLPIKFGFVGIWLAWPIGWVIGTAMSYVFYLKGVWKDRVSI